MDSLKGKWGILIKAAITVVPLVGLKLLFHFFNLEIVEVGPVITALIAGVFFVLAIILSGVLADFKESERVPSELAVAIEALYKDSRLTGNREGSIAMLTHLKELLHTMVLNFEHKNDWKLSEINPVIDKIDEEIKSFAEMGVPMPLLVKMRSEVGNIKKISHRVEIIKETSFIPGAYAIADLGTIAALIVLLASKIDPYVEGLILVGIISLVLISVLFLIKDMDNPFEGYVAVNLSQLYEFEKYLDTK